MQNEYRLFLVQKPTQKPTNRSKKKKHKKMWDTGPTYADRYLRILRFGYAILIAPSVFSIKHSQVRELSEKNHPWVFNALFQSYY